MFSKDAEKLGSFVGAESEYHGELTVVGTLRMDGVVTGRVQADQVILLCQCDSDRPGMGVLEEGQGLF